MCYVLLYGVKVSVFASLLLKFIRLFIMFKFILFILRYSSYLLYYNCSTDIYIHDVFRGPYCESVSIEHSYCT